MELLAAVVIHSVGQFSLDLRANRTRTRAVNLPYTRDRALMIRIFITKARTAFEIGGIIYDTETAINVVREEKSAVLPTILLGVVTFSSECDLCDFVGVFICSRIQSRV